MTCAVDEQPVRTSSDFLITVKHGPEVLEAADIVVLPPFAAASLTRDLPEPVIAALEYVRPGARFVSICTGAFVLAAAGLLDGRPATTHWVLADLFREWFPQVRLNPGVLFVDDGDVLTSAGAASGVDACLHLLRKDHGGELANRVARVCVVPPWRDGGEAQYSELPIPPASKTGTSATRQWALQNLHEPLSLADLARRAQMSARTFARRFHDEVGTSPGRWLIQQRVSRACHLLESSDLPVADIARQVGFATSASLRKHLYAAVGVTPLAYRRAFGGAGRLPVTR
ncbi:transcriptional regulator GlxA family with amidase domain [Amycolatopsis bartoniae]|uniref:Transcriptional regulator n=1 Tax=Amycolatopsis bartoniae TaxID=941986 RepID=A0A8H9IPR6_9PSEU|nr:helix-turn-helix domain-containing protein [Amycolatopsis bartoniae]MBB2938382.1 transcriptional regulator GlxA family with amidase domain [Amycolatopsis bartoniae]GHF34781.1 transcriptional regulator [Amycolatopsis bartoniae]